MSYYSDIRICTTKEGYEELCKFVNEKLEGTVAYNYNLMNSPDVFFEGNGNVYFGWNSVNHFYDSEEGSAVLRGLDYIEAKGHGYKYSCIGEALDDSEERCCDGENDTVFIEWPCLIRTFDDEDMKNGLSGPAISM